MSAVFLLFWVSLGAFVVDILLGKIGILTGGAVHQFLGDVPQFLLLAFAAACLTAECLRREMRRNAARAQAKSPVDRQNQTS